MASAQTTAANKDAEKKTRRWIWRGLDNQLNKIQDPSKAPASAEEHKRRLADSSWGPFLARLSPVEVVGTDKATQVASVKELRTSEVLDVDFHATLPWYEGLLLLQTMDKCKMQPKWFDNYLHNVLHADRTQRQISEYDGSQYVEKVLHKMAITGPAFIDSHGNVHEHRRTRMMTTEPPNGVTTKTHFAVKDLVGYLPPWEAVLHKSCGLYQDYYLVHWEDETPNLQDTESGSPLPGCSWEPDECVPDDMDTIRMKAKMAWVKKGAALDASMVLETPAKLAKRFYEEEAESARKKEKIMKMTVNPHGQPIYSDFHNIYRKHGWKEKPPGEDREKDEAKVKTGWPKKASDYPAGYGPANPPGCCMETCDCMEDWHLGKGEYEDKEQDRPHNKNRGVNGELGVNALSLSGLVNKRGMVSGMCHFEVIQQKPVEANKFRKDAAKLRQMIFTVILEVTHQVPLHAFLADDAEAMGEILIPTLVYVHLGGGLMPSRYQLGSSISWLSMEGSGRLHVTAEPPKLPSGGRHIVVVRLTFENIPSEVTVSDFQFKITNAGADSLQKFTSEITRGMQELRITPRLRRILESRLSPVCDCTTGTLKDHSLGPWLQAMCETAQVAHVCSTVHM